VLADAARYIMSTWRPLILAKNERDAQWLAYHLCMQEGDWQFIDDPTRLLGRHEPTVFVISNWRYQRKNTNWMAVDEALRTCRARTVEIPDQDELSPEQWVAKVLLALDNARQRPAVVRF
jgi:hypothetical protein